MTSRNLVVEENCHKRCSAGTAGAGKTVQMDQQYMFYTSSRSGAYIFRPHGDARVLDRGVDNRRVFTVCSGGPVVEYVQVFDGGVRQTSKVLKVEGVLSKAVQMLTSTNAGMNNEIVTRFNTDLTTNKQFFTDNSADFRERMQKAGSIASNFYPMNTAGALREKDKQVTFLNRQPMGCASLKHAQGQCAFEIMLHRQLRMDDGRGLAQGVHDNSRTSAPIWILLDSPENSERIYKRLRHHIQHDKVIFQASPGKSKSTMPRGCCFVLTTFTTFPWQFALPPMFNYDLQVTMQVRLPL